MLSWLNYNFFF